MTWTPETTWRPTRLIEVAGSVDTSTGATEVLTDAGPAFVKPMGNRQGPHVLATDWVGTHLARWFGLPTFDVALLTLGEHDRFALPRGYAAEPGPAFAARAVGGLSWGGSGEELDLLENPGDVSRLIVFDTWMLNCDRHAPAGGGRKPNYDNVFLMTEGEPAGRARLVAMDHGLCVIRSGEDLSAKVAHIDKVKDARVYGLFPAFKTRLDATNIAAGVGRLRQVTRPLADAVVGTIPPEWEVSPVARTALADLIFSRAGFVADNVEAWVERECPGFGGDGAA